MKLFTSDKIKELDTYTIENEPISSIELMERAARVFTDEFCPIFQDFSEIIVFAGPGNNGGDALAIARILHLKGYIIKIYLFNIHGKLSSDCQGNKERLLELPKIDFTEITNGFDAPKLKESHIVIDGLFGSGLNKPLSGGFTSLVKYINESSATIVSIDIPSGLFGEDNSQNKEKIIVKADCTFTFQFPKLSFLFPENQHYLGKIKILDIKLHPDGIDSTNTPYQTITQKKIQSIHKTRDIFAHKGNFGHALLIAGSLGKMGAAILSAKACLKSGAGLLTAHIPQSGNLILQTAFPETMTSIDKNKFAISDFPDTENYNAIAIGPGIGMDDVTVSALKKLLETGKPLILDADALNIISSDKSLIDLIPQNSILTPHPKEFDRLNGNSESSYERLQNAMDFAVLTQCYIILKGKYTAVCTPERDCYFNTTGNAGMATAGSGDVLTGILLGLSAQSYSPLDACLIGVYIHGLAGNLALLENSEESLIAGDIIKYLGKAFKEIKV